MCFLCFSLSAFHQTLNQTRLRSRRLFSHLQIFFTREVTSNQEAGVFSDLILTTTSQLFYYILKVKSIDPFSVLFVLVGGRIVSTIIVSVSGRMLLL